MTLNFCDFSHIVFETLRKYSKRNVFESKDICVEKFSMPASLTLTNQKKNLYSFFLNVRKTFGKV